MSSQCGACNRMFTTVSAFDAHRTGSFFERTRRCLSEEEIREQGELEQKASGLWGYVVSERDRVRLAALTLKRIASRDILPAQVA